MSAESVLVCVPTYNAGETLARTLESLKQQNYSNFRVVVMDNCSTDETIAIAQRYAYKDDRFSFQIADQHGSAEDNFNRCIAMAEGDFTTLFHSDDEYHPDMLSAQVQAFRQHAGLGVVFTRGVDIDAEGKQLRTRACPLEVHQKFAGRLDFLSALKLVLAYGNFFICPTAMFRSELLREKVALWDGGRFRSSADLDVWLRAMQFADAYIINRPLIRYRVSAASFSYNYRYLKTEPADIFRVLECYVDQYSGLLDARDQRHYRLQCFKDGVDQAVSHLIQGHPVSAREKLTFDAQVVYGSLLSYRYSKFLLFGLGAWVLSYIPLGNKIKEIITKVRFGR